jgi:acyl carrier protein
MKNASSVQDIIQYVKQLIARETGVNEQEIGEKDNFWEFGIDSVNSIYIIDQVESHFGIRLTQLHFWDYPTIEQLAKKVFEENS